MGFFSGSTIKDHFDGSVYVFPISQQGMGAWELKRWGWTLDSVLFLGHEPTRVEAKG